MTKRKSVVSKILLLLIVLTLISCCFLGSTFARYVSNGSGKASMSVAKWSISDGINEAGVEFGDLSPAMEEYDESNPRTNKSTRVLVATIKNDGDVDALVTLSTAKGDPFLGDTELKYSDSDVDPDSTAPTQAQAEEVFSIALYYSADNTPGDATPYSDDDDGEIEVAVGATIFVFADVTWTSDFIGGLTGDAADARDTWLGENVTTVNYVVSYTAVQNSKLPA